MYFYYKGLKTVKARTGAVAELFFPFFAVGVSWVFLGKALMGLQILGGVLLIISSFMIQRKKMLTRSKVLHTNRGIF